MRTLEVEELTAALTGPRPDRESVLTSFHRKHRRRKAKRRLGWFSGVAVCGAVIVILATAGQSRPDNQMAVSPAHCAPVSLAQSLAGARQAGASILVAYGSPAGRTAGSGYQAVVLHSVRTLSGPVIASGTIAWADGTAIGGGTSSSPVATQATSGQLLAIAWPAALVGSAVGPVVRTAPVIGGNVIVTRSGCWDAVNLATRPHLGVPPGAPSGEPAPDGLYAIPLQVVAEAAVSPLATGNQGLRQGSPRRTVPAPASSPSPGSKATGSAGNGNAGGSANGSGSGNTNTSGNTNGNSGGSGSGNANGNSGGSGNGNGNANSSGSNANGNGSANGNGKAIGKATIGKAKGKG
jgi:hypothetical protein